MKELVDFIKVALSHHRFGWIHPFRNGNGRVVRLLTYLLLIKYGFNVKTGGRGIIMALSKEGFIPSSLNEIETEPSSTEP
jgi:hypothetical protein